ncbi:MAG: purine-binding chemotaxis protein CheW [Actinobacteria bacterium]|nr:purine-binding chemotaxis protein CheW [Actinomycetota bacterium]
MATVEAATGNVARTICVFARNRELCGVDTAVVREIARMQDIAPVPNTPAYIDGVINLRGRIIPVVDLRTRFNMPRVAPDAATRIVVLELNDVLAGMVVDAVTEIRTIQGGEIDEAATVTSAIEGNFVRGLLKLPERLIAQHQRRRAAPSAACCC